MFDLLLWFDYRLVDRRGCSKWHGVLLSPSCVVSVVVEGSVICTRKNVIIEFSGFVIIEFSAPRKFHMEFCRVFPGGKKILEGSVFFFLPGVSVKRIWSCGNHVVRQMCILALCL